MHTIKSHSPQQARDQRLRTAVSTGGLARVSGVAVQLVAIPYAVQQIGVEAFGQYAFAIALFSWASLLDSIWGQALVRRVVEAVNRSDRDEVTSIVYTAFIATAFFVACGAVFLLGGTVLWIQLGGTTVSNNMSLLVVVAGAAAALKMLFAILTRARAAFQQLHVENILLLAFNCIAVAVVFFVVGKFPSALSLLLAISVPALIAQLVSSVLLYRGNQLLQGRMSFSKAVARELLTEGRWLSLGQIGVILERQAPIIMFTLLAMPEFAGQYAIALQMIAMSASILLMVTVPLMPAVADAINLGDTGWWSMRVRWLDRCVLSAGAVGTVLAVFVGKDALTLLFGITDAFTPTGLGVLALWITMTLSAFCYYTVLIAAGRAELVGKQSFVYGVLFLAVGTPAFMVFGFTGLFAIGAVLSLLCTRRPWKSQSEKLKRSLTLDTKDS